MLCSRCNPEVFSFVGDVGPLSVAIFTEISSYGQILKGKNPLLAVIGIDV